MRAMSNFKSIRERLGMTQQAIGKALGMTQGNVWFYEHGQALPGAVAAKLIAFARRRGIALTFDDIYAKRSRGAK